MNETVANLASKDFPILSTAYQLNAHPSTAATTAQAADAHDHNHGSKADSGVRWTRDALSVTSDDR